MYSPTNNDNNNNKRLKVAVAGSTTLSENIRRLVEPDNNDMIPWSVDVISMIPKLIINKQRQHHYTTKFITSAACGKWKAICIAHQQTTSTSTSTTNNNTTAISIAVWYTPSNTSLQQQEDTNNYIYLQHPEFNTTSSSSTAEQQQQSLIVKLQTSSTDDVVFLYALNPVTGKLLLYQITCQQITNSSSTGSQNVQQQQQQRDYNNNIRPSVICTLWKVVLLSNNDDHFYFVGASGSATAATAASVVSVRRQPKQHQQHQQLRRRQNQEHDEVDCHIETFHFLDYSNDDDTQPKIINNYYIGSTLDLTDFTNGDFNVQVIVSGNACQCVRIAFAGFETITKQEPFLLFNNFHDNLNYAARDLSSQQQHLQLEAWAYTNKEDCYGNVDATAAAVSYKNRKFNSILPYNTPRDITFQLNPITVQYYYHTTNNDNEINNINNNQNIDNEKKEDISKVTCDYIQSIINSKMLYHTDIQMNEFICIGHASYYNTVNNNDDDDDNDDAKETLLSSSISYNINLSFHKLDGLYMYTDRLLPTKEEVYNVIQYYLNNNTSSSNVDVAVAVDDNAKEDNDTGTTIISSLLQHQQQKQLIRRQQQREDYFNYDDILQSLHVSTLRVQ